MLAPLQPVSFHLRPVTKRDAAVWERLRRELWPDGAADHASEIADFFAGKLVEPVAVLVAEAAAGEIVAFAELSIRTDIPGLGGKPTGFVEGLYVSPAMRHRGVAKGLLQAARAWAGQQRCAAFASDRAGRIVVDRSFDRSFGS